MGIPIDLAQSYFAVAHCTGSEAPPLAPNLHFCLVLTSSIRLLLLRCTLRRHNVVEIGASAQGCGLLVSSHSIIGHSNAPQPPTMELALRNDRCKGSPNGRVNNRRHSEELLEASWRLR